MTPPSGAIEFLAAIRSKRCRIDIASMDGDQIRAQPRDFRQRHRADFTAMNGHQCGAHCGNVLGCETRRRRIDDSRNTQRDAPACQHRQDGKGHERARHARPQPERQRSHGFPASTETSQQTRFCAAQDTVRAKSIKRESFIYSVSGDSRILCAAYANAQSAGNPGRTPMLLLCDARGQWQGFFAR